MLISNDDKYIILLRFKNGTNKKIGNLASLITWQCTSSVDRDKIIKDFEIDNLILLNRKGNTALITKTGNIFLKKHNRRKSIEEFNLWSTFLRNVTWIIAFTASIIINIFTFLKLFGII